MELVAGLYVIALLVGISLAIIISTAALRLWHIPGARFFSLHVVSVLVFQCAFLAVAISHSPETAFFWARLRFLGYATAPPLFLLFVLFYTGRKPRGVAYLAAAMFVVPAVTQVIIWSDAVIPGFFAEWSTASFSFLTVERSQFAFWFQIHALHSYVLNSISYAILIIEIWTSQSGHRASLSWILAGHMVSLMISIIPGIVGNTLPLNISPLGVTIGLLIYAWGVFRGKLFDLALAAYQTVFVSLQDAVLVLNHKGEVIQCNEAALHLLNKPKAALMYQSLSSILTGRDAIRDIERLRDCPSFEITLNDHIFDARVSPLRLYSQAAAGYVLVLRDVTERVLLEEARRQRAIEAERLRTISQLISAVSHDFRTHLATIETNRYLTQRVLDRSGALTAAPQVSDKLQTIHTSVHHITEQLDSIMLITGTRTPSAGPVRLDDLIRTAVTRYSAEAKARSVALTSEVAESLPLIMGDATGLLRALEQVLKNAIVHTPAEGRVEVIASANGHAVIITICDTGSGIEPQHLPHLTEPFYRVDSARTIELGGVGIGLTVVKMATESCGGTLRIESTVGQGTTVTLSFPAARP